MHSNYICKIIFVTNGANFVHRMFCYERKQIIFIPVLKFYAFAFAASRAIFTCLFCDQIQLDPSKKTIAKTVL